MGVRSGCQAFLDFSIPLLWTKSSFFFCFHLRLNTLRGVSAPRSLTRLIVRGPPPVSARRREFTTRPSWSPEGNACGKREKPLAKGAIGNLRAQISAAIFPNDATHRYRCSGRHLCARYRFPLKQREGSTFRQENKGDLSRSLES